MKNLLLLLLVLSGSCHLYGQAPDALYSQFYAAPLQINPGFTGNTLSPHLAFNYRNQWPAFSKGFVTYSAAYSQFFEPLNSGFGLMVQSDNAGNSILRTNLLSAFYSYRVKINDDLNIKIGVEAGAIQKRLDWNRLVFLDQIDPITGGISPGNEPVPESFNKTYFDISAGLLLYGPKYYGGFSIKHLTTPDESFQGINPKLNTGLPARFTLHGGFEIVFDEGNRRNGPTFISPNFMFVRQGPYGQLNAGAYGGLGLIFAGAWYRHAFGNPDAAIVLAGVQVGAFKLGYSYDITISRLADYYTGGSHELSLIMNFDRTRRHEVDYNDCFKMFR